MDKTNKDHLNALKNAAQNTLSNSNATIQEIVKLLKQSVFNDSPFPHEQLKNHSTAEQFNERKEPFTEEQKHQKQLSTKMVKQKVSGKGNITIGGHRGISNLSAESNIDVDQEVEGSNNQTIGGNTNV